jgi:hypothetical protein
MHVDRSPPSRTISYCRTVALVQKKIPRSLGVGSFRRTMPGKFVSFQMHLLPLLSLADFRVGSRCDPAVEALIRYPDQRVLGGGKGGCASCVSPRSADDLHRAAFWNIGCQAQRLFNAHNLCKMVILKVCEPFYEYGVEYDDMILQLSRFSSASAVECEAERRPSTQTYPASRLATEC